MMLADIDLGQIMIIVVVFAGGFIHWLWKLSLQGRVKREEHQLTKEELEQRERAWRKQVAPESRPLPPVASDPWQSVKEVFDQLKQDAAEPKPPQRTQPPPLPKSPSQARARNLQPSVRAALPPTLPTSVIAPITVVEAPQMRVASAARHQNRSELVTQLFTPASLKQAILLREILGPPKALQTPSDSAFWSPS